MSRRGDNIRKRKNGRWEGRYIFSRELNGKAIYRSVYGKTYNEVKKSLVKRILFCNIRNSTEIKRLMMQP